MLAWASSSSSSDPPVWDPQSLPDGRGLGRALGVGHGRDGPDLVVVAYSVLARTHRDRQPDGGRREHPGHQVPTRPA
jgi:hypothetical protein